MIETCPKCGTTFACAKNRRPRGSGTAIDPTRPLNKNEKAVLELLRELNQFKKTVKEIAHILYDRKVPYFTRKGQKDAWSNHEVQITLSSILGRGLIVADTQSNAIKYLAPSPSEVIRA